MTNFVSFLNGLNVDIWFCARLAMEVSGGVAMALDHEIVHHESVYVPRLHAGTLRAMDGRHPVSAKGAGRPLTLFH